MGSSSSSEVNNKDSIITVKAKSIPNIIKDIDNNDIIKIKWSENKNTPNIAYDEWGYEHKYNYYSRHSDLSFLVNLKVFEASNCNLTKLPILPPSIEIITVKNNDLFEDSINKADYPLLKKFEV